MIHARRAFAASLLALIGACLVAAPASAAQWLQFRYGAAQTGRNPVETALTPATVGRLTLRWATPVALEVLWTSPLVAGNLSIVAGLNSAVTAVDSETGAARWRFQAPVGNVLNPIAATGQLVYVETDGGPLYALDVATGALRFRRDLGGDLGGGPTPAGGTLFVPGNGRLYALDPQTGAVRWSRAISGIANAGTPAYADGIVVEATLDRIAAFRADTGRRLWTHPVPNGRATGASIAGGSAYSANGARVSRYALATGRPIWSHALAGGFSASSTTAVAGGLVVYHAESDAQERLTARSAQTGAVVWSATYPHANIFGSQTSSPAIARGVVYAGFLDGHLRAFRATDGAVLADVALPGNLFASPSVVDGRVEIGSTTGELFALGLP
jgi:eukaryotic-like serine/threonine-protein kinase